MSAQKFPPDIERAIALGCAHPCGITHARTIITNAGKINAMQTLRGLVYFAPSEKTAEIEEIRFSVQQARDALLSARDLILHSSDNEATTLRVIAKAIDRLDGQGGCP